MCGILNNILYFSKYGYKHGKKMIKTLCSCQARNVKGTVQVLSKSFHVHRRYFKLKFVNNSFFKR